MRDKTELFTSNKAGPGKDSEESNLKMLENHSSEEMLKRPYYHGIVKVHSGSFNMEDRVGISLR